MWHAEEFEPANEYCNCNGLKVNIRNTAIIVFARPNTRLRNYTRLRNFLYSHAISCVLRGDGARLLVFVFVLNVTYTHNLK